MAVRYCCRYEIIREKLFAEFEDQLSYAFYCQKKIYGLVLALAAIDFNNVFCPVTLLITVGYL